MFLKKKRVKIEFLKVYKNRVSRYTVFSGFSVRVLSCSRGDAGENDEIFSHRLFSNKIFLSRCLRTAIR